MNAFRFTCAVVAITSMLLASTVTSAATITVTELADGVPDVNFSDFPSVPATICLLSPEEQSPEVAICVGSFSSSTLPTSGPTLSYVILLYENAALTTISDSFRIDRNQFVDPTSGVAMEGFSFVFSSNTEGTPLGPFVGTVDLRVAETGAPQSFDLPSLCKGCVDITVNLTSDREPGSAPEPATLALLGIGVAGLGFSRRRKSN